MNKLYGVINSSSLVKTKPKLHSLLRLEKDVRLRGFSSQKSQLAQGEHFKASSLLSPLFISARV